MSSEAIVSAIKVSPHPHADRLQIGEVFGYQVIVGLEVKDGDLGVFFQEGVQLSEAFATANNLVRRKDEFGNNVGGFFEENRRVRCQKFRKIKSEGFWIPLTSLAFTGYNIDSLDPGQRFSELNKVPICNKYYTPATLSRQNVTRTNRRETVMFKPHFDTDQLRFNMHRFKPRDLIVVTHKLHGTSARTGYLKHPVSLLRSQRLWNRIFKFLRLGELYATEEWQYVTGSRNVILDSPGGFRQRAASLFQDRLHKGETVFYEIVGYEAPDVPIMDRHTASDSEIKKKYGDQITYHYGCVNGDFDIYVYRITFTNEDGVTIDLPWESVKHRCQELGVKHTPEAAPQFFLDDPADIEMLVNCDLEEPCPIGKSHPREGYCVRREDAFALKIFKHKAWTFGFLEGYIKDKPDYVDTEEAA